MVSRFAYKCDANSVSNPVWSVVLFRYLAMAAPLGIGAGPSGFPLQEKRESIASLICPATSIKISRWALATSALLMLGRGRLQENWGCSAEPEDKGIASPFLIDQRLSLQAPLVSFTLDFRPLSFPDCYC
jgi:hypothetical protein